MVEGGFVHPLGDQRVIDVGEGHEPPHAGDFLSLQAAGISFPVPALMVRIGDDRAKAQKVVVPAHALFRPAQGLVAEGGVLLHLVEFGFRELAGLAEDAVRNADLADIVQRGADAEQLDGVVIVVPDIGTHEPQALGEDFHAVLRTADVRAGFVIAGFHDRSETFHRHGTGKIQFLGAFLDQRIELVVVFFERDVIRYPRPDEAGLEGLGDEVHGPEIEPLGLVFLVPHRGDDVAREGIGLEAAADFVTVHIRHHDIQKDDVGAGLGERQPQGCGTVGGNADGVLAAQEIIQDADIGNGVVDDEYHGFLRIADSVLSIPDPKAVQGAKGRFRPSRNRRYQWRAGFRSFPPRTAHRENA